MPTLQIFAAFSSLFWPTSLIFHSTVPYEKLTKDERSPSHPVDDPEARGRLKQSRLQLLRCFNCLSGVSDTATTLSPTLSVCRND